VRMDDAERVILSLAVGLLILAILWRAMPNLSWREPTPRANRSVEPPVQAPARPATVEELRPQPPTKGDRPAAESHPTAAVASESQQQYCAHVKVETLRAAKALSVAYSQGSRDTLLRELGELSRVYNEQQSGGHAGKVALTEYCNALVDADALDVVHALQEDEEPDVARTATELFQGVVPRIWSS